MRKLSRYKVEVEEAKFGLIKVSIYRPEYDNPVHLFLIASEAAQTIGKVSVAILDNEDLSGKGEQLSVQIAEALTDYLSL